MKGFNTHRHTDNPKEKEFHDEFIDSFMNDFSGDMIDYIVFGQRDGVGLAPNDYLTDREKRIVISTIQWLGSPVGKNFLKECGFEESK